MVVAVRKSTAIGLAASALLFAGCGQIHPTRGRRNPSVPVPTSDWHGGSGSISQTALTKGVLQGSPKDKCVWLVPALLPRKELHAHGLRSGGKIAVLWPRGFRARFHPVELLNTSGRVVARAGDVITTGGGITATPYRGRCMYGDRYPWVVQSQILVKAAR
jgi:hypothetical protein